MADQEKVKRAAKLFDVRRVIGGRFRSVVARVPE